MAHNRQSKYGNNIMFVRVCTVTYIALIRIPIHFRSLEAYLCETVVGIHIAMTDFFCPIPRCMHNYNCLRVRDYLFLLESGWMAICDELLALAYTGHCASVMIRSPHPSPAHPHQIPFCAAASVSSSGRHLPHFPRPQQAAGRVNAN